MPEFTAILTFIHSTLSSLLMLWGALTLVVLVFSMIVHSTSSYSNRKHFWRMLLLTLVVVYILSALLTLLFHLAAVLVAMISLLAAFVVQGDIGIHRNDADVVAEIEEAEVTDEIADQPEVIENKMVQ